MKGQIPAPKVNIFYLNGLSAYGSTLNGQNTEVRIQESEYKPTYL